MRSILVRGELAASDLAGVLAAVGADLQGQSNSNFGNFKAILRVGKKFFFRSNDYLGVVLMAASDGSQQRIDVSTAGGGSGLLGIQWGAGADLESSLYDAVVSLLQQRSLGFQELNSSS